MSMHLYKHDWMHGHKIHDKDNIYFFITVLIIFWENYLSFFGIADNVYTSMNNKIYTLLYI